MRLIDADAFKVFLEDVRQCYLEEETFGSNFAAELIETVQDNYLALAPTVDAVEVVRCKACKHRADLLDNGNYLCNRKMIGMVRPSDFCSFAERKTDG